MVVPLLVLPLLVLLLLVLLVLVLLVALVVLVPLLVPLRLLGVLLPVRGRSPGGVGVVVAAIMILQHCLSHA